jgi:hypothetical protein
MGKMNVAQDIHIVPLATEAQITSTTVEPHINMKQYEKVEFIYHMTAVAADDFTMTVTQSAATAGSSSTAIAARYRLTAAAGTDTMGDTTTLASTGLAITTSHSTLTLIVDVDSSDMTTESKPYVGLTFTNAGSGDITGTLIALCWPKYPKETNANALT